jgi:hypothetical protein
MDEICNSDWWYIRSDADDNDLPTHAERNDMADDVNVYSTEGKSQFPTGEVM